MPRSRRSRSLWTMPDTPSLATTGLVGLESHLLDRVEAAVIAVDLEGRILFVNRYAEDLYGWSSDETVGQSAAELAGVALDPEVATEIMTALAQGTSWEGTFEVERKDGSVLSVHAVDS